MKKRVLSFLLAVVMLIGLLPSVALFQASAAEVGDTHTVTYGTLNTKKSVSLPITVHNYPNDGMLFEYSSYVSTEDYNYAHAHAEKVTPGYGKSWYIYTGHTEMVAGRSMTYLGTYYIASKKNRDYLLCHDTTSDNGVKLFSHSSASIPEGNRRWQAYRDSSGNFQFVNIGSGKALDKNGNETNLHGWTPNTSSNQQWKFVANGDGSYKIFSVMNSKLIVDLADGIVADGNTISLYGEDNGTPAQSWYLVPVSGCEADLSGIAGNAMHVTRTASDEASGIGAYATVLEQGMIKEKARYLTLVYNVSNETANQFGDEAAQPFKLVPVSGEHRYALDVSSNDAKDGQKIQLWSSPDNEKNTTKYVLPEAAGDGSYYLRWYKCDAYGNLAATDFYIGGVTGNNQDVSCKRRENANRFHILQNADGSYLLRFADANYYGEPIYLSVSNNNMANGTRVSSWVWTGNNDEKYYFSKLNGTRITYGTENYRVYPGFDGQSTAYADVKKNGVNAALTAAPGYHTVTIDLASSAGFAAAQMISSLSASTPSGKRATLSLAAAGLFSTKGEAEQFGKAALCGLSGALSYGGYTASFQWVGTTKADYDVRATVGNRVRRYRMGNNLAFGMLLPNSCYGGANYKAFNNFGYAWGNDSDTTVPTNLANGKWLPYAVQEYPYTISGSNDGRWYVNGSTTLSSSKNYPTAVVNGTNYTDVSKFLPNMHSYIEGMATIGLVNYEIDPETKALTYTQQTVQKLAELLKQSLEIPEKTGGDYNYNFVQGAKLSGNKDWAQLIRDYLKGMPNPNATSTPESNWASYTQSHKSLLDLTWSQVTDGSHKDNFVNYLDVAYWMLNTLYKDNNGISQTVPEYTHMTLSQETNSAGNTYYVFDGGYDGVTYNANDGEISHVNGRSSKDMIYYTTYSDTTLHPFLPTTGSTTFQQTNTPYFLDSGASERSAASYESQIGRDYSFSMEGHAQFVFNTEDNLYFTFEGDDDVYLFINNKMVMDIGAAHSITKSTFNLNDYIKECGLKDGEMYDFDFYYMERHSYGSNIRIETNIDVTSKNIDTVKGATQNGTVVENGGLVDKTKELDYYITLLNTGNELPLKNVAFTDEQIGFAAGYDGVSLGSYMLNGTTYNRKIEDIKIVLTKADGSEINLTFASTGALQTFLTNVTCAGHETPGLQVGERLTIYGIKYGLTKDGTFRNTAYAEASALRTSSTFSVYAGAAQQYFMWAGHPIAVSASDAASVATNSGKVTSVIPSSANGTTVSVRPLADGVYSIGIGDKKGKVARNRTWSPKGKSGELQSWNANELYGDGKEGNEPLFYVKYAGNGYYTIYNLQFEQYVSIDAASGTRAESTSAVGVDDRMKLTTMTEAQAQANDTTLWLIERNNRIAPNSDQNAYTIRPKLAPKYGVDLDAGGSTNGVILHLWDVASSEYCGWYFNAHANSDVNMTGFEDNILIFEEQTPGTYTHYFKATYGNSSDGVIVPVVLHVLDVKDDTYVLDYGLPVNLNNANDGGLTLNDPIRPTGIKINTLIEGFVSGEAYNGLKQLSKDGKLTTKTNGVSGKTTNQCVSTYGTFTADNSKASATRVLFTPTKIMSGASTTKAIVRVHRSSEKPSTGLGNVDVHKEVEMYESLTTIPASVVYYEDNFAGIDYNTNTDSKIDHIGGGDGDYQDADQTGQYGHDSSYEGEGPETSGGSVTKITVLNDEQVASFKFRGTGFEVISRCFVGSANIIARVYDGSGKKIRDIPVITDYDNNADDSGSEIIYQAPVISVNDLPAGNYTVRIFVTASVDFSGWQVRVEGKVGEEMKYSLTNKTTGKVYYKYYNLSTGKSRFTDASGKTCTNPMIRQSVLYIDGVRIFNPIEGLIDQNGNRLDSSYLPTEQDADILQIHDQIEAGKITAFEVNSNAVQLGTGFSCFSENRNNNFINGNKVDSIEAYSTVGPNNEIYLDGLSLAQGIGFYVKPDKSVPMTERTVQIGVRSLDPNAINGYTTVHYETASAALCQNDANGGKPAWTKVADISTGTEQYYKLDPTLCSYDAAKDAYLVMIRPQNGMVSLTGLKLKGYTLVPAFDATTVHFNPDGKMTDESIGIINGMLNSFTPTVTSNELVPNRSLSSGSTSVVLGQGDPVDEAPVGGSENELPIDPGDPQPEPDPDPDPDPDPSEPKPDPVEPKPDPVEPKPENPNPPEKEPAFADISGTWYEDYVNTVAEAGIIKGYDDGLFHGDNHVTREEFAAMLVRALGLTDNGKACAFTDISGRWSEEAIRIAAQNGLVNGVDATTFAPDAEITRQEMMTMIARALKATGLNVTGSDDLSGYADANEVSGWAMSSVRTLVASGIISGDNGKLNPTGTCTRSEAAAVFSRLLALLK